MYAIEDAASVSEASSIPITAAFLIAATVSMVLVSGYLLIATGPAFARLAAAAQLAYMVLFSYSFFFDGFTGLTITLGAIATLAILMVTTARVDWTAKFRATPPPLPSNNKILTRRQSWETR